MNVPTPDSPGADPDSQRLPFQVRVTSATLRPDLDYDCIGRLLEDVETPARPSAGWAGGTACPT